MSALNSIIIDDLPLEAYDLSNFLIDQYTLTKPSHILILAEIKSQEFKV